ncbi:TetR/AcrR family transcriptional regulator [Sungkyunkwania multivorans]|uniref:TetR/AcrR family transcriptional regulator n=1 Tax=Sungkyunkwania multivorans TaxID=1173618 RepID=A0ABW3CVR9_9FLAO
MSLTKAQKTTNYIIETVAPIFNQNGYAATSLSDITSATGLTKGAIYGNFENKEDLAMAALKYNIKKVLNRIEAHMEQGNSPTEKLLLLTDFYRNYYHFSQELGGCPIINVGVDANNQNDAFMKKVQDVIELIEHYLAKLIDEGKEIGEIRKTIMSQTYAKRFYSLLQGATFMAQTMKDNSYIHDAANVISDTINQRFRV